MSGGLARSRVGWTGWRLTPARFPAIASFEQVSNAADLQAVMTLEGWTNDRLVAERLRRLPEAEWCYGVPNASVIMGAFLHAAPTGARFNGPELGAWYASAGETTAIAEVAHHLRRELFATGLSILTRSFQAYTCRLLGDRYVSLLGRRDERPDLYASTSHARSQAFGAAVRASGDDGILFNSVRHRDGNNVVTFRPRCVGAVTATSPLDIAVRPTGAIVVTRLSA